MAYYKYISVIEVQDLNGKPLDKRRVVFGKKVSMSFNVTPLTLGYLKVIHIEKLPFPMEEKDIWRYIHSKGKAIFKYCLTKSLTSHYQTTPYILAIFKDCSIK